MMNLYLLRHASAGTKRPNPLLDVKRPLDRDGKQHSLRLAHLLNSLNIQFDLIASSPLKRALQTASLLGTEIGYDKQILLSNGLAPAATFADFENLLNEIGGNESVLLVGHNPNLSSFLGRLMVPRSSTAGAQIRLRKGTLARLVLDRGTAQLQALIDPRVVRTLYSTSTKGARRKATRKVARAPKADAKAGSRPKPKPKPKAKPGSRPDKSTAKTKKSGNTGKDTV